MKIRVKKITDSELLNRAAWFTSGKEITSGLSQWYKSEHSPIRTQWFWIEMISIPTFVAVHLVRHKFGVEHYVRSNRIDRGGNGEENRYTPVDHAMMINAQALINMSRKRLCTKASKETREVLETIKALMFDIDSALANHLVPDCQYRGMCPEFKPCGRDSQ